MGNEKYIDTKHKIGTKQYLYSFTPKDQEGEADFELLASAKNKNGNYSRFDIFVLLQYAEASSVDFPTLIRTLFFELAQVFPPEELLKKISNNAYSLYVEKGTHDGTSPTGMLEFIGDTSEAFGNYSKLLSQTMETEAIKNRPMDEDAKEQIVKFLGERAEKATVSMFKEGKSDKNKKGQPQEKIRMSEEEMNEIFKNAPPLISTMASLKKDETASERFKKEAMTIIGKESPLFKEVLVPSRHIVCKGIDDEILEKVDKEIKDRVTGRLIIRWNRRT